MSDFNPDDYTLPDVARQITTWRDEAFAEAHEALGEAQITKWTLERNPPPEKWKVLRQIENLYLTHKVRTAAAQAYADALRLLEKPEVAQAKAHAVFARLTRQPS